MGNLTKNISRHEIACNCGCGFDSIDIETINVVQECCDHFAEELGLEKVFLGVNSGCRCLTWNAFQGSASTSQHTLARAIDFHIIEVAPRIVYKYLNEKYPNCYGIGNYKSFTHLDTKSGKPRRW